MFREIPLVTDMTKIIDAFYNFSNAQKKMFRKIPLVTDMTKLIDAFYNLFERPPPKNT